LIGIINEQNKSTNYEEKEMTFANHGGGGFALGWVFGKLCGFGDFWLWLIAILCALIAMVPDVGSWFLWKLSYQSWWKWKKWDRWELYGMSHPPLDGVHGKVDCIMKWFPPWGLHTWVIDSIVHPSAPKFIFPKFPIVWMDIPWVSLWNKWVFWTKWDVLYVLLEAFWWGVYALLIIYA
jgi:hypothetical protein